MLWAEEHSFGIGGWLPVVIYHISLDIPPILFLVLAIVLWRFPCLSSLPRDIELGLRHPFLGGMSIHGCRQANLLEEM